MYKGSIHFLNQKHLEPFHFNHSAGRTTSVVVSVADVR